MQDPPHLGVEEAVRQRDHEPLHAGYSRLELLHGYSKGITIIDVNDTTTDIVGSLGMDTNGTIIDINSTNININGITMDIVINTAIDIIGTT